MNATEAKNKLPLRGQVTMQNRISDSELKHESDNDRSSAIVTEIRFWCYRVSMQLSKCCQKQQNVCGLFHFLPNVEISQTDDWRGGCAAASVTSIRLDCIYLLG